MVGWLLAGLILAGALFALLGWWARTDVATAKKSLFWGIVLVCGLLGLVLFAAGKGFMAVVPAGFAAWRMIAGKAGAGGGDARSRRHEKAGGSGMSEEEALDVLGLTNEADEDEINQAYRRLMAQCHPDKGGNDWMASKLNEAKQVLLKK